jgi:hypothetical protein
VGRRRHLQINMELNPLYMKTILGIFIILSLNSACSKGHQIDLYLTDGNSLPITRIDNFYLTSITKLSKPISLGSARSENGKFSFKGVAPDTYFGLIQIKKGEKQYDISFDSLPIKNSINVFRKKINLGSVELPQPLE